MAAARPPLSLKARAIALLAQREQSASELRRKLLRIARERDRPPAAVEAEASLPEAEGIEDTDNAAAREEEVDALLAWLRSSGYLDESRFVESRIHTRSQRYGQRRIEQELAQHGLAMDALQRAALAAGELDRACEQLMRKFSRAMATGERDAALEAKQLRFLLSRGFGTDVARRAVREVPARWADADDLSND